MVVLVFFMNPNCDIQHVHDLSSLQTGLKQYVCHEANEAVAVTQLLCNFCC